MKILFDQGTPAPLRYALHGHQVFTTYELGWSELQNGKLLKTIMDNSFDCFITTDQNLPYQQNLSQFSFSTIILQTTSWPRIKTQTHKIQEVLTSIRIGDCVVIEF